MANRNKVNELTLYQGLSLITALYNDTKHSTTNLTPRQIVFGNSTSLNLDDINLTKHRAIITAKENTACEAKRHNSKLEEEDKEYENIRSREVLAKTKAKSSPYHNRYRIVNVQGQDKKTITDDANIKIHKKTIKRSNQ